MLHNKVPFLMYFCGYILPSFEENKDFQFLDKKMPSAYEVKLLFRANVRSAINMI